MGSVRHVEDAAAIFALDEFFTGLGIDGGGGDHLPVAATAAIVGHGGHSEAELGAHEAFIERQGGAWNLAGEIGAIGADLGLLGKHALLALGDGGEVLGDEFLGVGQSRLGSLVEFPTAIDRLHRLQFQGFKSVDLLLVSGNFVVKRLVLVVFTGFELLDFEAFDRGAAGLGIELDFFHFEFGGEQGVMSLADGGLIAGEFGFGASLVNGEFFKVFGQRHQAAITVLEDQ